MEIRISVSVLLALLCITMPAHSSQEFIKPKKKIEKKIKPEDCYYAALPLLGTGGRVLQELGSVQEQLACIIEQELLKKISQVQLQEFKEKQDHLKQTLYLLERELHSLNEYIDALPLDTK